MSDVYTGQENDAFIIAIFLYVRALKCCNSFFISNPVSVDYPNISQMAVGV